MTKILLHVNEEDFCEYKRLKELKKTGRLVELPCRLNEEVWVIKEGFPQYPAIKKKFFYKSQILNSMENGYIFGKTKEEAEAKLAKMKEAKCYE